jgi:hypothetical protein
MNALPCGSVAISGGYFVDFVGGARRNRTDDLFNAIEALSQLSYGPILFTCLLGEASADARRRGRTLFP